MIHLLFLGVSNPAELWRKTLFDTLFYRFLLFTLEQTLLTILLSVLFGVPVGYLLARKKPFFGSILRSAITVPFLFPPLAILLGFVVLFGEYGYLNTLFHSNYDPFSFSGIVLAHTMYNISVIARISESAFANEPADHHIVARTLGANRFTRFRSITIPHIKPSLEASILLVFLYTFNSFAIVLILGEVKLQTLEVMIYTQSRVRLNFDVSSILVIFQLVINLLIIIFYSRRIYYRSTEDVEVIKQDTNNQLLATFMLLFVILITWSPLIILLGKTVSGILLAPDIFKSQLLSGSYDRLLGTSSLRVLVNTLFFGLITAASAFLFSMLIIIGMQFFKNKQQVERLITIFTLLPMATSAISISFAIVSTHGSNPHFTNWVWVYIIIAQLLASLPFASRSLLSAWKRVPEDLLLISQSLSAPWTMSFEKVVLPFMKSAILVSVLFSFAISIGEFGATYYLTRGEWITLSISIYKLFSSRNIILPYIYASMLVIVSFFIFLTIEKLGKLEMRL